MNIVSVNENKLLLNSGISESNFGRMNYADLITEPGLLAVADKSSKGDYKFIYEDWCFEDVISKDVENRDERVVFYSGELSFEYDSFCDLNSCDFDDTYAVLSCLTQAAFEKEKWPENGAGGTIIFKNKSKIAILFLPQNLYNYSVQALPLETQGTEQNLWKNDTLHELAGLTFTRGIITYHLLTGKFPYPEIRSIERNADILDRKYTPIEVYLPELPKNLITEINNSLSITPSVLSDIKLGKKYAMALKPKADFPLKDLYDLKESAGQLQETARKNSDSEEYKLWVKKQSSKIDTKRNIRRNRVIIVVAFIIAVVLGLLIWDAVSSRRTDPTSRGLTAEETIEAYYVGFGKIDTEVVEQFSKGKGTKSYSKIISQVFVISKQRASYSPDMSLLTPAGYLTYAINQDNARFAGLFGITNLEIDGKAQDMVVKVAKRKDKPEPITMEKGITLEDKMTSVHKVNYYRLHNEGEENNIYVEYHTDTVTLTYEKDRWIITNIDIQAQDIDVNTNEFFTAYWSAVNFFNGDVKEAMNTVRPSYKWVPSQKDIEMEERYQIQKALELQMMMQGIMK